MKRYLLSFLLAGFFAAAAHALADDLAVQVPAGLDHAPYDRLLKKYVDSRGLVAYQSWKDNAPDRAALEAYIAQFAASGQPATGNEKLASLINAYNAFVLEWILQKYPTESIQSFKDSFTGKRYRVRGEMVSLDDIENGTLRPLLGYRTHAGLVCAARSCPPLQQSAYVASDLDEQIALAYRTWLARTDMNTYSPEKNEVSISSIFKWFKKDFDQSIGVPKVLGEYAPSEYRDFLLRGGYSTSYKNYNWGLNDQGSHGRNYSTLQLYLNKVL